VRIANEQRKELPERMRGDFKSIMYSSHKWHTVTLWCSFNVHCYFHYFDLPQCVSQSIPPLPYILILPAGLKGYPFHFDFFSCPAHLLFGAAWGVAGKDNPEKQKNLIKITGNVSVS